MKTLCSAAVLLVVLGPAVDAGTKTAFAVADMFRFDGPRDVTVAPDGKSAVFIRAWIDAKTKQDRYALWRVAGPSAKPHALEKNEADARVPLFSPDGKWIVLEDLGEAPHRIDRQFAHLKLAGWFEKCAGVLVGDFHMGGRDQAAETLAILDYHLPTQRSMPVVQTNLVGHTWPQAMLPVGRALTMRCQPGRGRHKDVTITWPTDRLRVVGA